jgi:hypothetical protein
VSKYASWRKSPRPSGAGGARFEPETRQAVRRFVRLLGRAGYAPPAIEAEVRRTCAHIPRSWSRVRERFDTEVPGHVLTLWFSDPAYLDAHGNPRALLVRGATGSLESLVRRVDPKLEVEAVARYLSRGGALRRQGTRYVPRERTVIFRSGDDLRPVLGGLFGLLKTLEPSPSGARIGRGTLQRYASNSRVPVSAVPAVEERMRRLADGLLVRMDADMAGWELKARKGEPKVRIGIGVYQFVDDLIGHNKSHATVRGRPRRAKR